MRTIKIIFIKIALLVITTVQYASSDYRTVCEELIAVTGFFPGSEYGLAIVNFRNAYWNHTQIRLQFQLNNMRPHRSNLKKLKVKRENITLGYYEELIQGGIVDPLNLGFMLPDQWCDFIVDDYHRRGTAALSPFKEVNVAICKGHIIPTLVTEEVVCRGKTSILYNLYTNWSSKDIKELETFLTSFYYGHNPVGNGNIPFVLFGNNVDIDAYLRHVTSLPSPSDQDLGDYTILYTLGYFQHVGSFVNNPDHHISYYPTPRGYCDEKGTRLLYEP